MNFSLQTIFWYLTKAIQNSQKAVKSYTSYYHTNNDKDYGDWIVYKSFGIGLAIIIEYNLSHFPDDIKKINNLFNETHQKKIPEQYSKAMDKLVLEIKELLKKEIQVSNTKNYLNDNNPEMQSIFKNFLKENV